ncbi:riboflavin synthase [Tomitella cavernea]|uniref:Riboflavin synthase n=1 Tax=Tomitella cavernea TaxID=1387982 RepID=A0ABP9CTV1_9ACTN|nr:riboflavin synthase [Tomitella cavernea]
MFTGIIEEVGEITAVAVMGDSSRFTVRGPLVTSDAGHGDSIAVNGVCLTVVDLLEPGAAERAATGGDGAGAGGTRAVAFTADVMHETLSRSSLGDLRVGSPVNLERAAAVSSRLGGHIVQGHVDTVGTVVSRTPYEHWEVVRVAVPTPSARYVVEKGSITVDGVSLTVSALGVDEAGQDWFEVSLIPTTLASTVLGTAAAGTRVNLEVDVIAKYVERLLGAGAAAPGPQGLPS